MEVSTADFKENDFNVPQRDSSIPQDIVDYLESKIDYILDHTSVNHPFLKWYADNELTKAQEKVLYLETYAYFRYLPFYVANISTITRDEAVLREVLNNSIDELGTNKSHSQIYDDFLNYIGIEQKDIEQYEPLKSSIALNEGIRDMYNTPPIERALGAIFADETQSAAMCSKYNNGLVNQGYSKKVRGFWVLHIAAEIGHSNSIFNILASYVATKEGREQFESGVNAYLNLMEAFWDGVQKRISESA